MTNHAQTPQDKTRWHWYAFTALVVVLLAVGGVIGGVRTRGRLAVSRLEQLLREGTVTRYPMEEYFNAGEEVHNTGMSHEAVLKIKQFLKHGNEPQLGDALFALSAIQGDRRSAVPELLALFQDPKSSQNDRLYVAELLFKIAPDVAATSGAATVWNTELKRRMVQQERGKRETEKRNAALSSVTKQASP